MYSSTIPWALKAHLVLPTLRTSGARYSLVNTTIGISWLVRFDWCYSLSSSVSQSFRTSNLHRLHLSIEPGSTSSPQTNCCSIYELIYSTGLCTYILWVLHLGFHRLKLELVEPNQGHHTIPDSHETEPASHHQQSYKPVTSPFVSIDFTVAIA